MRLDEGRLDELMKSITYRPRLVKPYFGTRLQCQVKVPLLLSADTATKSTPLFFCSLALVLLPASTSFPPLSPFGSEAGGKGALS